jgi:hypothetical protein
MTSFLTFCPQHLSYLCLVHIHVTINPVNNAKTKELSINSLRCSKLSLKGPSINDTAKTENTQYEITGNTHTRTSVLTYRIPFSLLAFTLISHAAVDLMVTVGLLKKPPDCRIIW